MAVISKLFIGGSEVIDCWNYNINKSIGEINQASNFTAKLDNYRGGNADSYVIGNEVEIYADLNPAGGSPSTKIFNGILENIKYSGREQKEVITLIGRDYSARLQDRTVEPEVYNSLPAGSIVRDIVSKYVDDITTTNTQDSTTTIDRISFSHTPVFDAIKQLADLSNFIFYVDNDKDLHFEERGTTSTGYTFDNTNILQSNFKEYRDTIFNQIWVYGDRYLDGFSEEFAATAGSAYTLLYKPHNTSIVSNGSIFQPGGIYQLNVQPGSEVMYLVNYDDKQIVLVSGTNQGDNVHTTGSIIVDYDRALPIVKVGDDEVSKSLYGQRVKVIQDKSIKDPLTAKQILTSELSKYTSPFKEGNLDIKGIVNVTPGQTAIVNIPFHNINNQTYEVLESNYNFNIDNNQSDNVLNIKLNKKIDDVTDTLKDLILEQRRLQSADMTTADILTRFQWTTGSFGVRTSGLIVYESEVTGSASHLYSTDFIPPTNPFHLASGTNQGWLSGSPIGSAFTPFSISWSGGYV